MKKKKSLVAIVFSVILTLLMSAFPVMANATPIPPSTLTPAALGSFTPSTEAIEFTNKMFSSGLISEFSFDKKGELALKDSLENIKAKYNLDDAYMQKLELVLKNGQKTNIVNNGATQNQNIGTTKNQNNVIQPNLSVSGATVYFTNSDVTAFLFAAASVGPAAVFAALDALATITGGLVGTAIVTILGIIGFASLAQFTYYIIQAEYYGQGVYIGIQWNGLFPNIVQGTW